MKAHSAPPNHGNGPLRRAGVNTMLLDCARAANRPAAHASRALEVRELDIVLEVECGVVGGEKDGVGHEAVSRARALYDAGRSAAGGRGPGNRRTRALPAGGDLRQRPRPLRPGQVQLRPRILADGQETLERAHPGARFQYVFHGASGSSPEELRAAVDNGVVKVNLDSETQYAFTRGAAEHMIDHRDGVLAPEPALGDKRAYDPAPDQGTGPSPARAAAMAVRR